MTKYCEMIKELLVSFSVYEPKRWNRVAPTLKLADIEAYPDGDGHDKNHVYRVMRNALHIQREEGGDVDVLLIAAILHDVHRHTGDGYRSPLSVMPTIERILEKIPDLSPEQVFLVKDAVGKHEIYCWNDALTCSERKEILILRDADNLDAMGAVGCARTFAFGATHGVSEYDLSEFPSEIKVNDEVDYVDGKPEISTLHHFQNKLLRLGDALHTVTARRMAKRRMAFMRSFYEEYLKEIGDV